jgi:mannan endo-1,4-beta-mannosidase
MAWELANEPRGINNQKACQKWIASTAALIKQIDPNHLVTTGSEGTTSAPYAGNNPEQVHADKNIDYQTVHVWVENWSIFNPGKPDSTYKPSVDFMVGYLQQHEEVSRRLNKPMVVEEFGISRDGRDYDAGAPTTIRDAYFNDVFETVYKRSSTRNSPIAGVNFWVWAGEGRPQTPGKLWNSNHDFIGDPPHEAEGWYSVYDKDSTTLQVISRYAKLMRAL